MIEHRFTIIMSRILVVAACVIGIAGCESKHSVAQVRGKVVFKNGTMPSAGVRLIRFECAADTDAAIRKGASGAINDDGSFELYTRRPGDGVHLGKYDVTFAICRGAMDQRPLIPAKYTKPATTPFHVVVIDDVENLEFAIDQGAATSR